MSRTDFGRHYLVDFVDCDPEIIKYVASSRPIVMHAVEACGATIITDTFHQFEPFGVSGIVLIAESHVGFHSWPENGFAAADIFTCGEMRPEVAIDLMKQGFRAREAVVRVLGRGQLERA
jgi:S-adenosylmethionine decarboxylase proenzyme